MTDQSPGDDERFVAHVLRPAKIIRSICQMIIGAGLAVALVLKVYMMVLTDYQCVPEVATLGNAIRCTSSLEFAAYALALAAGFELAYLLFEDTLERVMRPLLFAISASFLLLLSGLSTETANWQIALTVLALTASLTGGLAFRYWMRRGLLHRNGRGNARGETLDDGTREE